MIVEHLVVALGLAPITVDRVVEPGRRDGLEMHRLARERPEPGGDEQEPGEELRPVGRRAEKRVRLLGEVEEDRGRIEHPRRLAAGPILVDDRREFAVGIDGAEGRRVLLPLPRVDRDGTVREARLLEEERDLQRVRRGLE